MLYRLDRRIRFGLLLVLTIGLVSACGVFSHSPIVSTNRPSDCRMVQHAAGDTCVPLQPQRVVALDSLSLEYLLALGIQPVGAVLSDAFVSQLHSDLTGITDIGNAEEPSLEKILALQPDLILGGDFHQTVYTQSSQIAPTVLYAFEHSGQWKSVFMSIAQMLQKTTVAEQVMKDYDARLDQFRRQMGDRLEELHVSVVRIYPDRINLYLKDAFCGVILQDAGLRRPDPQNISASEAEVRFGNPIQVSISQESLAQADADVMFLWTGENTVEANQQAQQQLTDLKQSPLWQQLRVVQQNTIYQVPGYWIGSGPIAARAVIDDLFKYLIEPS